MSKRSCTDCQYFQWWEVENFDFEDGRSGFSAGGLTCGLNNFCEENPANTAAFRLLIAKAETCKDFAPLTQ